MKTRSKTVIRKSPRRPPVARKEMPQNPQKLKDDDVPKKESNAKDFREYLMKMMEERKNLSNEAMKIQKQIESQAEFIRKTDPAFANLRV